VFEPVLKAFILLVFVGSLIYSARGKFGRR
jgi:hypothetical protein